MKYSTRVAAVAIVLIVLIVVTVLVASATRDEDTPDVEGISVVDVSPKGYDVAQDGPITMIFSRDVDSASAEAAFVIVPPVPGHFSWQGRVLTFIPSEPLQPHTMYRVTIGAGVRDTQGYVNELVTTSWPFETQ